MSRNKKQSGFTLIEFILYLSLTVGMLLILSSIGAAVLSSRIKAHDLEEIHYTAEFAQEKIRSALNSAESVTAPEQGVSATSLTLEMRDATKNPTVIDVYDGRLRITEGTQEAVFLTHDAVVVADVLFTHAVHEETKPALIGIEMHIGPSQHAGYAGDDVLFDFKTSVVLKK